MTLSRSIRLPWQAAMKVYVASQGAQLVVEVQADLWSSSVSPEAMGTPTILNLAKNACEALPTSGGLIQVAARNETTTRPRLLAQPAAVLAPGDYVVWTVRDNGFGMSSELLASVWGGGVTTKPAGSGCGLQSVRLTVERGGGRIQVVSAVNVGTTVSIFLPAHPARPVVLEDPLVPLQ